MLAEMLIVVLDNTDINIYILLIKHVFVAFPVWLILHISARIGLLLTFARYSN